MKFRLLVPALLLGLLFASGCATRQLSDEPVAPAQPAAAPAPTKAAKAPAQPAPPLAAARARESELSDNDLASLRQNLGKDAFDQTGTASWGDMPGLTAAHSTLPVGAKVEITNLDNSRRAVVMITDRSPSGGQGIEVSRTAAEQLGMLDSGTAKVGLRVLDRPKGKAAQKAAKKKTAPTTKTKAKPEVQEDDNAVSPEDMVTADEAAAPKKSAKTAAKQDKAAKPKAAPAPTQTAAKAPAKAPAAKETPPAAKATGGKYYVQVGSFASTQNAEKLVKRLKDQGYAGSRQMRTESGGKVLYRVQAGSFPDKAAADAALKSLKGEFPSGFVTGN